MLDDEIPALRALSSVLEDGGVKVVSASSTEEAVQQVANNPGHFSALIMDVRMNDEDLDGLDATNEIQHSLCRSIPAIIVSAYSQNEAYLQKAQKNKLQIQDWLEKPILDDVHDQLMHHIEALAKSSKSNIDKFFSIYNTWVSSQAEGQQALREFMLGGDMHDPLLVTNALVNLEERGDSEITDFIAHVNFLAYEKTVGSLWELHGNGYVAFWKGKKVGFAANENALIKTVFETEQTTDFFFAPVSKERVSRPAGPIIVSNPYPE